MKKEGGSESEDTSTISRKRIAASVISVMVAGGLIVVGVLHDELGEVMFNASMLCLSCIGMG